MTSIIKLTSAEKSLLLRLKEDLFCNNQSNIFVFDSVILYCYLKENFIFFCWFGKVVGQFDIMLDIMLDTWT